jgi:hydrogenase nickel incorporation protein HypA/HybF
VISFTGTTGSCSEGGGVHELPITQSILDIVLAHARANQARKVVRIHLTVGELSELRQEWVQRYFDYLSRDTPAEGAEIAVERIPAAFRCLDCGRHFEVGIREMDRARCPGCSGTRICLERGDELLIRDMEVE